MFPGTLTFLVLHRVLRGTSAYEYAITNFILIRSGLAYKALAFDQSKRGVARWVVH